MSESGGTEMLNLSQNNLSLVPELPLSSVLSKMKEVSTGVGEFRFLFAIPATECALNPNLKKKNLNCHLECVLCYKGVISSNSVIPETFLQVNLTNGHLSPGQARSLLTQVADGSNLSSLKISENDLSSVPGITFSPFLLSVKLCLLQRMC